MPQTNASNHQSVLIVESNTIIGMYLADDLESCGYTTAGPFNCAQAVEWLVTYTPDIAVLDVDLQSGPCVELARELKQRGISIIVYSAHEQRHALPEFHNIPWVSAPAPEQALLSALRSHCPTQAAALNR